MERFRPSLIESMEVHTQDVCVVVVIFHSFFLFVLVNNIFTIHSLFIDRKPLTTLRDVAPSWPTITVPTAGTNALTMLVVFSKRISFLTSVWRWEPTAQSRNHSIWDIWCISCWTARWIEINQRTETILVISEWTWQVRWLLDCSTASCTVLPRYGNVVNEWMDGWMNKWMDGWMNKWMDGW